MPHEPTLGSPWILWYFHNFAPSLTRSTRIPKLTKPALLDGAAKRNAKLPSNEYTGGSISKESSHWIRPWPQHRLSLVPMQPWSRALAVPRSVNKCNKLAPEPPPAPSFGSDLITYLFALLYSELLWNDNLLRTEVFLPPCQHSIESLPLTPAAPPARSLSKRFFPFGLYSALSCVDFACIFCAHACMFFFSSTASLISSNYLPGQNCFSVP